MALQTISSADASAIIDQALLGANAGKAITGPAPDTTALAPGPLPTDAPEDDEQLTPKQRKARAEAEQLRQAQEDMLGKEAAQRLADEQAAQEAREKTLLGAAEKLASAGKASARKTGDRIASLPTPGNLMVPLILLLAFFFILVTYNGSTRLQWLWLVLTNNAYVTPSAQGASAPSTLQPTGGSGPGPLVLALPASFSPSGMGGNPYS